MAYRANPSDKEQHDIERAADDSGQRLHHFDGAKSQEGKTKYLKAYDAAAPRTSSETDSVDVSIQYRLGIAGGIVGTHNDKPHRFSEPGKA